MYDHHRAFLTGKDKPNGRLIPIFTLGNKLSAHATREGGYLRNALFAIIGNGYGFNFLFRILGNG